MRWKNNAIKFHGAPDAPEMTTNPHATVQAMVHGRNNHGWDSSFDARTTRQRLH
jgi:hypothetical protein